MNDRPILTDALVERMLAYRVDRGTPEDLRDAIGAQVARTPQVRPRPWARVAVPTSHSPALRLAWLVALVGLLLAATVSAVYVGSEMLRRTDKLSVVLPAPSATPALTEHPPTLEPIVSDTALGTITWRVYDGLYRVPDVDTPHGPVGLASGDPDVDIFIYPDGSMPPTCALSCLFWLSPDGTRTGTALPELTSGLVPVGDDLIAYSNESAWRVSWDGSRWVLGDQLDLPPYFLADGTTLGVQLREVFVATGSRGVLIVGEGVVVAPDGRHFVSVEELPGGSDARVARIGPVIATADGFIALVSPGGRYIATDEPWFGPVPWFSADGLTWEPAASSSPFGEDSWIREVAGRDGRYVAVGNTETENGPWAVWVSDDGRAWETLLVPGLDSDRFCAQEGTYPECTIGATAGDAGWVISTGRHQHLWASADGLAWERLTVPGISIEEAWGWLPGLALHGDTIVVNGSRGRTSASAVGTIEP